MTELANKSQYKKIKAAKAHLVAIYAKIGVKLEYSRNKAEWPNVSDFIFTCASLGLEVKL